MWKVLSGVLCRDFEHICLGIYLSNFSFPLLFIGVKSDHNIR